MVIQGICAVGYLLMLRGPLEVNMVSTQQDIPCFIEYTCSEQVYDVSTTFADGQVSLKSPVTI
jgi:hypothetical protein